MNWSRPISNNSFVIPAPPLCSTGARGFLTTTTATQHVSYFSLTHTPLFSCTSPVRREASDIPYSTHRFIYIWCSTFRMLMVAVSVSSTKRRLVGVS